VNQPKTFRAIEHKWLRGRSGTCWQSWRASPSKSVDTFIKMLPEFGPYGIGVLKSEFLRIRKRDLFARGASTGWFTDMNTIGITRLRRACWSHGHLSVFFATEHPEELLAHYLSLGFFRQKGRTVHLGSGEQSDAVNPRQAELLGNLIASYNLSVCNRLFSFSHDADYFYEVFLPPQEKIL
jgi:hypothetical protein